MLVCTVTVTAAGCSSSGAKPASTAAGSVALTGNFIVALNPATATATASTTFLGRAYDGPTPPAILWTAVGTSGGCTLSRPHAPFCSPACANGMVCSADFQCTRNPVAQDLGRLTVRGLGTSDIAIDPILKTYQLPGDLSLPFPPATEGAPIDLVAPSAGSGGLSITAMAVLPLEAPTDTLPLERGKPLGLTWTAPGQPDLARMEVKVDISHHGGISGMIGCEVADTGTLTIAADLVSGLIDLGVAGFPAVELTRIVSVPATAPPPPAGASPITFQIVSAVSRPLQIPGFTSCHEDAECGPGKLCQTNLLCQP